MSKVLRIVFCILSCLCLASCAVVGAIFGFVYCLIPLGLAAVFAAVMFLFRNEPWKKKPEQPKPDFMNTDEENECIRSDSERS